MPTRDRIRQQWDRLSLYLLLVAFGVLSLVRDAGTMADSPRWLAVPVYGAFIVAGFLLMAGWATDRAKPYLAGNVIGALALGSVAVTVAALNGAPGFLLIAALALALLVMMRRTKRDNRMLAEISAMAATFRGRSEE